MPTPLSNQLLADLEELKSRHRYRSCTTIERPSPVQVLLDQELLTTFSSNDYLGLALHPALQQAANEAAIQYGVGASASRLLSGTFPTHLQLENALASFLKVDSATLFSSGYHANLGTICSLARPDDLIVADRAIHASLIDGCRLSRAKLAFYPHLDYSAAEAHLRRLGGAARRRFLVTESLFSMDGDVAPLTELAHLAKAHDAIFIVDEAHAVGALGPSGAGLCAMFDVQPDVLIGTLGKAFGTSGAFVAGSANLKAYLINKSRSFIFTTALPPPIAAAALVALTIISSKAGDELRSQLATAATHLRSALSLPIPPIPTPIIPILLASDDAALHAASFLRAHGFLVPAIRPPAVKENRSRLRITLSSHHTPHMLSPLANAILNLPPHSNPPLPRPSSPPIPPRPHTSRLSSISGLFLVGTDTAVGKTTVAAALLRLLSSRGRRPVPFKPVETGASPHPSDAVRLQAAAGRDDIPITTICPFPFTEPLAPSVASAASQLPISIDALLRAADQASSFGDFLLVESAGGLLTPYAPSITTCDIASAFRLPLLLLARNSLGTINHTALAVSEIRRRCLPLLGIILVTTSPSTAPDHASNASEIAALTGISPLGTLPYIPSQPLELLAASLQSNIDLTPLLPLLR